MNNGRVIGIVLIGGAVVVCLLGAAVTFEAHYNIAAGYSLQAILTNAVPSY